MILNHDFPGNVRELKSIMYASVNLAQGKHIAVGILPDYLRTNRPRSTPKSLKKSDEALTLEELEKRHILRIYADTGKNKTHAAKQLGIGINTLRRKLESYGME